MKILEKTESMSDDELKYEPLIDQFYELTRESQIDTSDEKLLDRYIEQMNRVIKVLQGIK
jgi:hypothetical protein